MNRHFIAKVIENRSLTPEHFLIRLKPEGKIIKPTAGQFYLLRVSHTHDPLLRRPFSIFRYTEEGIEFFIQKKGKGTTLISEIPFGEKIDCIGPLGRGYPLTRLTEKTTIVAGGMGIASVFSVVEKFKDLTFIYGARTKEQLFFLDELTGVKQLITVTDDGTIGLKGNTVDVLKEIIGKEKPSVVFACGPEKMNMAIVNLLKSTSIEGYVSFEEKMACGVGACLGCIKETGTGMKRVCTEGPVFSVEDL